MRIKHALMIKNGLTKMLCYEHQEGKKCPGKIWKVNGISHRQHKVWCKKIFYYNLLQLPHIYQQGKQPIFKT